MQALERSRQPGCRKAPQGAVADSGCLGSLSGAAGVAVSAGLASSGFGALAASEGSPSLGAGVAVSLSSAGSGPSSLAGAVAGLAGESPSVFSAGGRMELSSPAAGAAGACPSFPVSLGEAAGSTALGVVLATISA